MSEYIGDHIKAVLFDHDDTLVGTIEAKWKQHEHIARTYYGKELTAEELRLHWGKPLAQLACLLYGVDDPNEAMSHIYETHAAYPKAVFPDTIPVLRNMKAAGKLTGVITATNRFSFEHDLTSHGIPRELIDYTQTEEDTIYHKPDPRVFEPAIAWLDDQDVAPSEVVYVGDGLHDMKAATGAGFNFIGVETGLVTADEFMAAKVTSVSGIAKLLH